MNPLNNPVLLVVFAAVFFYALYGQELPKAHGRATRTRDGRRPVRDRHAGAAAHQ
ncbi:hypothetical protein J7E83_14300 [Arthrobacter sp. ISL-48]|uniref:hypothetical protein n=1 Tax=Arthrobacter sp. ISL-48 TaxID=2819110 RepID=UPI001BE81023|nr:hypothetical protein [Arthrobacter sp. ISL-48]MBT2533269.1 hypothetical protein [Arthrobacter sp. ISL-48]